MYGAVARRPLPAHWHVCDYPGQPVPAASRRAELAKMTAQEAVRTSSYDMGAASGQHIYVPADDQGELLPEYLNTRRGLCARVNEASEPGELPNTLLATDLARDRISMLTARPVAQGEELLTWYGAEYGDRPYELHWTKDPASSPLDRYSKTRAIVERGNRLIRHSPPPQFEPRETVVRNLEPMDESPLTWEPVLAPRRVVRRVPSKRFKSRGKATTT